MSNPIVEETGSSLPDVMEPWAVASEIWGQMTGFWLGAASAILTPGAARYHQDDQTLPAGTPAPETGMLQSISEREAQEDTGKPEARSHVRDAHSDRMKRHDPELHKSSKKGHTQPRKTAKESPKTTSRKPRTNGSKAASNRKTGKPSRSHSTSVR